MSIRCDPPQLGCPACDGAAIYLSLAAVYLAQATGTDLTPSRQLGLVAVMILTSKGAAGVAGGGFLALAATLGTLGTIPPAAIMPIFGIGPPPGPAAPPASAHRAHPGSRGPRQLALSWGTRAVLVPEVASAEDMVRVVDEALLAMTGFAEGDVVVIAAGAPPHTIGVTDLLRVRRPGD